MTEKLWFHSQQDRYVFFGGGSNPILFAIYVLAGLVEFSRFLKIATFRKPDMFSSSGQRGRDTVSSESDSNSIVKRQLAKKLPWFRRWTLFFFKGQTANVSRSDRPPEHPFLQTLFWWCPRRNDVVSDVFVRRLSTPWLTTQGHSAN
jgi:hypothetical protein